MGRESSVELHCDSRGKAEPDPRSLEKCENSCPSRARDPPLLSLFTLDSWRFDASTLGEKPDFVTPAFAAGYIQSDVAF